MSQRFRRDATFEPALRAGPEFRLAMSSRAAVLADMIRLLAPRKSGHYARRVVQLDNRVELRDIAWHIVEWGSVNSPAYAPVRRAVRAVGLRYIDARSSRP